MFLNTKRVTRMLLASWLVSTSAGAVATNIPPEDRIPRPPYREESSRDLVATDFQGGWQTFLGDLHVHSRGHGTPSPNVNRGEVYQAAWHFGLDFLAITNHSTSWDIFDDGWAPTYQHSSDTDGRGQPNLVSMNGVESYLGPNNVYHFNVFNELIVMDTEDFGAWHNAIASKYTPNPSYSTHVQLNHPNSDNVGFYLPTDPEQRRKVRDAIELAEFNGNHTFFELLRRGFRVGPAANSDTHAQFRSGEYLEQNPDGTWVRPYIPEPGVPMQKITGDDVSQGRTGIYLPPSMPFNYSNFLSALRNRWVFKTSLPGASGFLVANGHVMGNEFDLGSNELRLDFMVYGTTKNGTGGGGNEWKRLEVWSPFKPEAPIKVFNYTNPGLVNLQHSFSLTPYESIYVVKLIQNWRDAEVVLAPIWINNPRPKPVVSFSTASNVYRSSAPCLVVFGGGDNMQVQRATFTGGDKGWQGVGSASEASCYPIDTTHLPTLSEWRVVDRYHPEVVSNSAVLTLYDALDVSVPTPSKTVYEGNPLTIEWKSNRYERVAYHASRDRGATWTQVGEETVEYGTRQWNFPTEGWGNAEVMIKVVSLNHPGIHGATAPVYIWPATITATAQPFPQPIVEGDVLTFNWTSQGDKRVSYLLSKDDGATWTPVATEPVAKSQGEFTWNTSGWLGQSKLRIVDTANENHRWTSQRVSVTKAPLKLASQPASVPYREGQVLTWTWNSASDTLVAVSTSVDNGATWSQVRVETEQKRSGDFAWDTKGSSCTQCRVRFHDVQGPTNHIVSNPVWVQKLLHATSGNASVNARAAYTVTDGNPTSCWWTSDGNEQWIDVDLGVETTVGAMEVHFGTWNPSSWRVSTSVTPFDYNWGTQDSGSLSFASNQTLVRDYQNRSGGGLRARYIRFHPSGTFPGTTYSQVCEIRLFQ